MSDSENSFHCVPLVITTFVKKEKWLCNIMLGYKGWSCFHVRQSVLGTTKEPTSRWSTTIWFWFLFPCFIKRSWFTLSSLGDISASMNARLAKCIVELFMFAYKGRSCFHVYQSVWGPRTNWHQDEVQSSFAACFWLCCLHLCCSYRWGGKRRRIWSKGHRRRSWQVTLPFNTIP